MQPGKTNNNNDSTQGGGGSGLAGDAGGGGADMQVGRLIAWMLQGCFSFLLQCCCCGFVDMSVSGRAEAGTCARHLHV